MTIVYRLQRNGQDVGVYNSPPQTVENLPLGVPTSFRVRGEDTGTGAVSRWSNGVVFQQPFQDIVVSEVGKTSNTACIVWTNPDNLLEFRLLKNGEIIGISSVTNATFDMLTESTQYTFGVQGNDGQGNWSGVSTVNVTTDAAGVDPEPPEDIILTVNSIEQDRVTLSWVDSSLEDNIITDPVTELPITSNSKYVDLPTLLNNEGYQTSRVLFVSETDGNDATGSTYSVNDITFDVNGIPQAPVGVLPYKTFTGVASRLRNGSSDIVLVKRGDVFEDGFVRFAKDGKSKDCRTLIATYGSGDRPIIPSWQGIGGFGIEPRGNMLITGLRFGSREADPQDALYDGRSPSVVNFALGGTDCLLEDCELVCSAISILGEEVTATSDRWVNFVIRNCLVRNCYGSGGHAQGLYADNVHGLLLENCAFVENGYFHGLVTPTIFNHNVYIQNGCTDVVVKNNYIIRGSSHGLQLRCGGVVDGNVFIENSIQFLIGGGDNPELEGVNAIAHNNLLIDGTNITDSLPRKWGFEINNTVSADIQDMLLLSQLNNKQHLGASFTGAPVGESDMDITLSRLAVYNSENSLRFMGNTFYTVNISDSVFVGTEGDVAVQSYSGSSVDVQFEKMDTVFEGYTSETVTEGQVSGVTPAWVWWEANKPINLPLFYTPELFFNSTPYTNTDELVIGLRGMSRQNPVHLMRKDANNLITDIRESFQFV